MAGLKIWQVPLWLAETNAWIVAPDGPGGECVLVDAPPDPASLIGVLQDQGLRLAALLTTHGHVDHVGGIGEVVRHEEHEHGTKVPVHIHHDDEHMLLDPVGSSGAFGRTLLQQGLDVRPPELVYGLDDGQVVSGAGMRFTCLHTPGHTKGSVCLRLDIEADGGSYLFSGDHLFAGSVGRTDLPGGSHEALMRSMVEKILPLPDELPVLPGHGGTTTIGRERAMNPFIVDWLQDHGGPGSSAGWG